MSTSLKEHPTVEAHRKKSAPEKVSQPLDAAWLRQLCLGAGADDVGFVAVDTLRHVFQRKCVLWIELLKKRRVKSARTWMTLVWPRSLHLKSSARFRKIFPRRVSRHPLWPG